ncbi:MAG: cytochrome C oxidase subunit II [Pseudomonadota bacterium]
MGTSYTPPTNPDWWREPIERTELVWIVLSFTWCLFMFGWMIGWHWIGNQNMSNETYKTTPEAFAQKVADMQAKFTVRKDESTGEDVVAPPPGTDVYLAGMQWQWRPILEFQKGKTYRLHMSSLDVGHGFSLQPENINFQVYPGYEQVMNLTPNKSGVFSIACGEYCGGGDTMGHQTMLGRIYVKE